MASLRSKFEKELRAKLSQKSNPRTSEEAILIKSFKYFDLDSSGDVNFEEFTKAIEKIGVQIFSSNDYRQVFEFYDTDRSGSLDYKEFAAILFGNASASSRNQGSPIKGVGNSNWHADQGQVLIEKLGKVLAARGPGGIIGLGKQFRIADKNKNRELEYEEFKYALRDFGTGFKDEEIEKLFDYFDQTNDGKVNFDEFIYSIRGNMNSFRKALVLQAFKKVDRDNSGELTIDDLAGVYNTSFHAEVKAGRKTEKQVLEEFLDTFHGIYDYHAIRDDKVTADEFVEYYNFISASIDNDQYFELMINNAWRINEGANKNWNTKGWSGDVSTGAKQGNNSYPRNSQQRVDKPGFRGKREDEKRGGLQDEETKSNQGGSSEVHDLLERIRSKLGARGTKGFVGIQRQFKIMDDDNDNSISLKEFSKAMRDYKIDLNDQETRKIYNYFDADRSGRVEIDEFILALRGEMNNFRADLVKEAFQTLDKDNDGVLRVNDIKGVYSARQHPAVKSGKKTEDEILGEFLETFEAHHHLKVGSRDQEVTVEEFIEYYNNVSASIDNDKYFEQMIVNSFKLWTTNQKFKEYAPAHYQPPQRSQINRNQLSNFAPFGTSNLPTDYSTSLRPNTSQSRQKRGESGVNKPAGIPSWLSVNNKNQSTNQPSRKDDSAESILQKFKEKIFSRGARGILGLQRLFKIIDDDNSKTLNANEFYKCINDLRLDFTQTETKILFDYFDTTKDELIDYDEFLRTIRGEMNERRVSVVTLAFKKLDKTRDGFVTLDDIRGVYDAKNHPEVKKGKKTEDEILGEFLDTFEQHHALKYNDPKLRNKQVTLEEFIEYYRNISCSIDNDDYFELVIRNAWNLDNRSYGKGWAAKY